MVDRVQQILQAAEMLRKGDVASGMKIIGATEGTAVAQVPDQSLLNQMLGIGPATPQPDLSAMIAPLAAAAPTSAALPVLSGLGGMTLPGTGFHDFQSPVAAFGGAAGADAIGNAAAFASLEQAPLSGQGVEPPAAEVIDPERLRLAQAVGSLRLRLIQEAAQQQYIAAYAQQVMEVQQLHEKQQEAAQLALIMEAAEAQAEMAKQSLEDDKEEHHWHRRVGRDKTVCGHWQRGYCARGDGCQFGHPEKEKGTLQTRGPASIMRHNFKTVLCKFFTSGACPQGTRCMFAHGPQDLRSPGMSLNKDEEEIVQRVASARTNRTATGSSQVAPGPSVVAPPNLAAQLQVAQLAQLAGLTGGMLGAAPAALAEQPQADASQLLASLAGLSQLGIDPSAIDLTQLAGIGGLSGTAPFTLAHSAAAAAVPAASELTRVGIAPPQLSLEALRLLEQSQGALGEGAAKRARVG